MSIFFEALKGVLGTAVETVTSTLGSIWVYLAIGAVVIGIGTCGYFYIESLEARLQTAAEIQGKLSDALEAQKAVMQAQKEDVDRIRLISNYLNNQFNSAQKDVNDLARKFRETDGKVRDMVSEASKKPKEMESKLNIDTKFTLRCNEIATGSPVLATDDINDVCRELIKSRK